MILISIDTLRADHLGCYGYRRPTSPAIDELADHGVLLETVMAQAPWTLPSHVSLVTGLYPHRNGVTTKAHRLDPNIPTIAGILAKDGYSTCALVNSGWLAKWRGFSSGFRDHVYFLEGSFTIPAYRLVHRRAMAWTGAARKITDRAIEWTRKNRDHPFFLFIHYFDVHSDYGADEGVRRLFVDPNYTGQIDGGTDQLLDVLAGRLRLSEDDVKHLVNLYDAEIRQLDSHIARLLRHLEEAGLAEETLVVLTSDHGEEFAEHGGVLHGRTMFEEVIAVPLILRGPGVPVGVRVSSLAQLVDVVPTLLGLLGVKADANFDGSDLRSHWTRDGTREIQRLAFAEADKGATDIACDRKRMVRSSRFKLIHDRESGACQVYDLTRDPCERMGDPSKNPEVVRTMMESLHDFMRGARSSLSVKAPSREEIRRLQGLGYIQ